MDTKKIIATTTIAISLATGGYLLGDKDTRELERVLEERSYIHAKQVIDARGDVTDLRQVIGEGKITRLVIDGVEYEIK